MEFKPLPIGIDNFEKLITRGYYFIDKTLLIKDLLDNKTDVNLFTRPRRFGKTLNMSMLQYFFEDSKKDNSYLFEGLNIMNAGEKYTSHMGKYPVINLSLKSAKQPTFELAYISIRRRIAEEYKRHEYILEHQELKHEKERYLKILKEQGEEGDYIDALYFLSECLEKYHNKKVIILIDEYDVPLENAFFEGFYDRMIKLIRSLFESALKTNSSLEFSVITGCLRISRESIFTGLNNLNIISILNDRYAEYFGFSDNEVKELTKYYNMEEKYSLIKEWYNGYIFGNINVYNPWSVIKFIYDLLANINVFPSSYWANTSSNSIVKSLIEKADDETKAEIETLIEGKTIEKPIHEDITYDEVYDTMDNLYNFMFFTGYFKKIDERIDERTKVKYLKLKIPNEEIKYIFREKVLKWFNAKIKAEDLSKVYTSVLKGDVEVFQTEINRLLRKTISFNDAYENFYHGFVVGVLSGIDGYIVKSNRESGDGRSDIYIRPLSIFQRAVIIEIKVCDKPKELFTKCDKALEQIEKMKYEEELKEEGYEDIIKYGMAFYRKDCLIKVEGV
ncbi:AAA family ATPase [Clostridium drakei]|uniref:AAA family ATPase n=1 Tax=Clostridium drakei TaxID=332101 RepID=A0A2U8DMP1_9CLOT|nr:AAA family ATPase [Clostridium drakei]AWI03464.1 AAA family ATPase [Clostridium drakei]